MLPVRLLLWFLLLLPRVSAVQDPFPLLPEAVRVAMKEHQRKRCALEQVDPATELPADATAVVTEWWGLCAHSLRPSPEAAAARNTFMK